MTSQEPVITPPCPLCGVNDRVGRDTAGKRHLWLCGACWTVFQGGEDEWRRFAKKRTRRHKENGC